MSPLLKSSTFNLALACLSVATAHAATIDVTSAGATQNEKADCTVALQKAIDQSAPGDTIRFSPGVYEISKTIVFKSDRDYAGPGATLKRTTPEGFAASTEHDRGKNITITGLTFESGGISFSGSGKVKASRIRIQSCAFTNLTEKKYPYNTGIYVPIGATECEFAGNTFRNIHGDNGLATWNLDHTQITDNSFDGINECMHLNGTTTDCQVLRNSGVHVHRMGIEIQGSGNANLVVEDNHFANWDSPFHDSFGLSIVPNSGPNISVRYNTVLARPPVPGKWTERFGFGIELGGDVVCRDNLTEGYWWIGIVIGGKNTLVTHNAVRGPNSGEYTTPTKINLEPGSQKETDTVTDNVQTVTESFIENPTDLKARIVGHRVELTWTSRSTNHTGFKVEKRKAGGDYGVVATLPANATSYEDAKTEGAAIYRLQAFNEAGDITYSPSILVAAKPGT